MANRRTLKLSLADDRALRQLYVSFGYPVGQYNRRRQELLELTGAFNAATGRNATPEEILHYMIRQRKDGKWETFDGHHNRLASIDPDLLTPEQWETCIDLYLRFNFGADTFFYDKQLAKEFATEFARQSGVSIPPHILAAALVDRRKAGNLPKLHPVVREESGFTDFDQVG